MNDVCVLLWDKESTLKSWAKKKGFKYRTVQAVAAGNRGKLNVGVSKRIRLALISDGLLQE